MKNNLTDTEKKWIKNEIECEIESVRTDGNYEQGVTFDKQSFDEGDFVKHKIAMLSELYKKVTV